MTDRDLTCGETVRALWDYVDNALESPMREEVRRHLAGCKGCAGHVTFARWLVERVRTMPVAEADVSALERSVRAALAQEQRSA